MPFRIAQAENSWRLTDHRLSQLLLGLLVPVMVLQILRAGSGWMADPVLLLSGLLFLLCGVEWWWIRQGRRVQHLRRAIPFLTTVLCIAAIRFNQPTAVMWLPVTSFLIFMHFPVRSAQVITLVATVVALLTLSLHWQVETALLLRTLLCSAFIFALLTLFFQSNRAIATELTQTNQQLNAMLEDYTLLRQREMRRSREQMIHALTQLSQYRDQETGQHIVRTQLFIERLAHALEHTGQHAHALRKEDIELIVKAAPMHDLGKIGVPDQILRKPGRHTYEETLLMRTHASIGEATLLAAAQQDDSSERGLLQVAARIAGAHHENWDGTGYPRGLSGEAIPLEARLMAVADVYDALTTPRHYKAGWTHEEACAEILSQKGRRFDPAVVEAFEREQEAMRWIAEQYKDTTESPTCPAS